MNCDHLDKFEEKHVISILMYVAGNPGCKKTDIYDAVSRNPRMPEKIEILESMGLMTHETVNRSLVLQADRRRHQHRQTAIGGVERDFEHGLRSPNRERSDGPKPSERPLP